MAESTRFVILSLEEETYAIPLSSVVEITALRGLERDKNLTEIFEGKTEFRGKWLPVVNTKKLFRVQGLPGKILLVLKSAKGMIGLLVDAVAEVFETDRKATPVPPGVINPTLTFYRGLLRHKGSLVLLLNEDGLL